MNNLNNTSNEISETPETLPVSHIEANKKNCQVLAISYVPMQHADWDKLYDIDRGLDVGTVFPELNLPFMGERGKK